MNVDPVAVINALLAVVIAGLGYWLRTMADAVNRLKDDLAGHKLYAAENYIKDDDLQKLRDELIGHLDRIEKLVATAIQQRRRSDPGE